MVMAPRQQQQLVHLRQKTLASLTKLNDRDTFSLATSELHSLLLHSLDAATLPTFLSAFVSTLSSPSSSARKHILSLVSALSKSHPSLLSPHVSSLVPPLSRLVRDSDSSVRSALPSAVASLPLASPEHLDLLFRTFSESLFTEQDPHARVAAAACLAAVIEKSGARKDGGERLGKVLGKCEKAMRSKGWKGKVGAMTVVGSVIGGARRKEAKGVVGSVMVCLGSEDWAERKAAAEVLLKLVDNESAGEFRKGCVAALEKRRFDKVKVVREAMNQALEAWKQVPEVISEISPHLRESSVASLKENVIDGTGSGAPKSSPSANPSGPPIRKRQSPLNQFTPPGCLSERRRNGCKSTSPALPTKKPWKVEISVSNTHQSKGGNEAKLKERDENIIPVTKGNSSFEVSNPETRRALYRKSSDENVHQCFGLRSGSRLAPSLDEESPESAVVGSISADYLHQSRGDCEDLSTIRNQLLQIEKQQSSLLDLLQKFMGSSQNGMRSLETRVHGLEMALDEISYDLAVTSGRMTNGRSTLDAGASCCLLPGDFLGTKFWRKPEGRSSSSSRLTPSFLSERFQGDKSCNNEATNEEIRRFRPRGNKPGFIVNPLAKIPQVVQ
ncbi:hypothetical protein MLD38_012538 [Melastoma candidum]|uniref:Uncharacterized protein n=1 Tax=Melastoma candidum TaxID=119954 RepID=A0ACB9RF29_9MYRT|nr:hypothetical protein MLD38_012538 [Melastoma candidum]